IRFSSNADWLKPLGAAEVWLQTSDNENLNGWFFRSTTQPSRATIIYFHGNGGNITNVGWVGEQLSARGFDVLLFDYRGYGKSSGFAMVNRTSIEMPTRRMITRLMCWRLRLRI